MENEKTERPMPDSYYKLLRDLQAVDFVLVELTLYLDTHPDDLEAVKHFNTTAKQSKMLRDQMEREFGPMLQYGNSYTTYPWAWKDTPWPWQV